MLSKRPGDSFGRKLTFQRRWEYGSFTRVSAVDGAANADNPYFVDFPCTPTRDGHIGYKAVTLSLVHAMERALSDGVDWAIIFEDDAEVPSNLLERINSVLEGFSLSHNSIPRVVWLDERNHPEGYGIIPGCCVSGVLYHRSAMEVLARDMYWPNSELLQRYRNHTFFPKNIIHHDDCRRRC